MGRWGDEGYLNWLGSAHHVDYPASSPHVVAVAGTRLLQSKGNDLLRLAVLSKLKILLLQVEDRPTQADARQIERCHHLVKGEHFTAIRHRPAHHGEVVAQSFGENAGALIEDE